MNHPVNRDAVLQNEEEWFNIPLIVYKMLWTLSSDHNKLQSVVDEMQQNFCNDSDALRRFVERSTNYEVELLQKCSLVEDLCQKKIESCEQVAKKLEEKVNSYSFTNINKHVQETIAKLLLPIETELQSTRVIVNELELKVRSQEEIIEELRRKECILNEKLENEEKNRSTILSDFFQKHQDEVKKLARMVSEREAEFQAYIQDQSVRTETQYKKIDKICSDCLSEALKAISKLETSLNVYLEKNNSSIMSDTALTSIRDFCRNLQRRQKEILVELNAQQHALADQKLLLFDQEPYSFQLFDGRNTSSDTETSLIKNEKKIEQHRSVEKVCDDGKTNQKEFWGELEKLHNSFSVLSSSVTELLSWKGKIDMLNDNQTEEKVKGLPIHCSSSNFNQSDNLFLPKKSPKFESFMVSLSEHFGDVVSNTINGSNNLLLNQLERCCSLLQKTEEIRTKQLILEQEVEGLKRDQDMTSFNSAKDALLTRLTVIDDCIVKSKSCFEGIEELKRRTASLESSENSRTTTLLGKLDEADRRLSEMECTLAPLLKGDNRVKRENDAASEFQKPCVVGSSNAFEPNIYLNPGMHSTIETQGLSFNSGDMKKELKEELGSLLVKEAEKMFCSREYVDERFEKMWISVISLLARKKDRNDISLSD